VTGNVSSFPTNYGRYEEKSRLPARQKALVEAMGAENFSRMMKGMGEVFQSIEATLFSASPEMSYAPKAVEDEDPAFWRPKAAPAAAAKPKEPKGP
jgi:sulfite reductase beta subunit-like hemoprotein